MEREQGFDDEPSTGHQEKVLKRRWKLALEFRNCRHSRN